MKLYVGNFIYATTEKELKRLFSSYGSVIDVRIIHDQFTRQSKCFGYVEMLVRGDGKEAINQLNGKKVNERHLVVKEAVRV
ncbi:MAG: RNA-binding protein [Desulfobulbaceae bacterium]|nr:RNA-binding protein [Desulfobulbaceae bacterium]